MLLKGNEIDIQKVKLVIWDLDNTLWDGTISETQVFLSEKNKNLIKKLAERGIVNSICSKNDFAVAKAKLEEYGIWDLFVFPSIDWTMKGIRIKTTISDMALRPVNVLFVDDEPLNLQNAIATVGEELMCAAPEDAIFALESQLDTLKVDVSCPRLQQYKTLEQKREARNTFSSDEDFLKTSEISVVISENCSKEFDRLLELINRSNQLNYTKERINADQFRGILDSEAYRCGYVWCRDKYGVYGIVGFFALDTVNDKLRHFLFSCRTLGMGIEQYVYAYLGYPALDVVGEVVVQLNDYDAPTWVTLTEECSDEKKEKQGKEVKVLVKGPCDVAQIIPFFSEGNVSFEEEFSYVSASKKNLRIDAHNHTTQILRSGILSDAQKNELAQSMEFLDEEFYKTAIFTGRYDYVLISVLVDASLGLYRNKHNPEQVLAYEQYKIDVTDEKNWDRYTHSAQPLTTAFFKEFKKEWEFVGVISDDHFLENLKKIRELVPDETKIIFLSGAEIPYAGKIDPEYTDRHLTNGHFNELLYRFVSEHQDNCKIIDVNQYLDGGKNYADTINHYKKVVYYQIANELQAYIAENSQETSLLLKDKSYLERETRKQNLNLLKRKIKHFLQVMRRGGQK